MWRIQSLGQSSTHSLKPPLQNVCIISLVDCLTLWSEFKVDNTLDIEESVRHCEALSCFVISTCELSWVMPMPLLPFQTLSSAFRIILKPVITCDKKLFAR
jgi:hypothetical protein